MRSRFQGGVFVGFASCLAPFDKHDRPEHGEAGENHEFESQGCIGGGLVNFVYAFEEEYAADEEA